MSEVITIPEGWELKRISELVKNKILEKVQDGNHGEIHPKNSDFVDNGIPFIMASDIKKGKIDLDSCNFINEETYAKLRIGFSFSDDILLSHKASIGFTAIVPKDLKIMLTPQVTYYRILNKEEFSNIYLYYYFQSNRFQNILSNLAKQSTRDYIGISKQGELSILFPKEKKEQEKIAKILSTLDTTIESTKKLIDKEKNIKKGLMNDLLQNGIDKNGKIRTPQTHKYIESELGLIPEEWEVDVIGNHTKIITGDKDTQDRLKDGKYPFYVRSQTVERINSHSFDGEAVLTAGDGVGVGKVFHHINEKFDFHQRVYCIHDFDEKLDPKFFFEYFRTYFIEQVNKYSAKGSVDSVRYDMIALMNISLPQIEEQKQIAKILTTQDTKIEKEEENLSKLKELKKGLMTDLLSGKVRVKV